MPAHRYARAQRERRALTAALSAERSRRCRSSAAASAEGDGDAARHSRMSYAMATRRVALIARADIRQKAAAQAAVVI